MRGSLLVSWQFIFSIHFSIHFFICLTFLAQLTERPSLLNDLVPVTWALTLKTTATSLQCTHHATSVSVLVHLRYQRWLQCKFSPQKWLMSSLQEKIFLDLLISCAILNKCGSTHTMSLASIADDCWPISRVRVDNFFLGLLSWARDWLETLIWGTMMMLGKIHVSWTKILAHGKTI